MAKDSLEFSGKWNPFHVSEIDSIVYIGDWDAYKVSQPQGIKHKGNWLSFTVDIPEVPTVTHSGDWNRYYFSNILVLKYPGDWKTFTVGNGNPTEVKYSGVWKAFGVEQEISPSVNYLGNWRSFEVAEKIPAVKKIVEEKPTKLKIERKPKPVKETKTDLPVEYVAPKEEIVEFDDEGADLLSKIKQPKIKSELEPTRETIPLTDYVRRQFSTKKHEKKKPSFGPVIQRYHVPELEEYKRFIDKGPLNLNQVSSALVKTYSEFKDPLTEEAAKEIALKILDIFGYSNLIVDGTLSNDDRSLLNDIEDIKIGKEHLIESFTEELTVTICALRNKGRLYWATGKDYRIGYRKLNRDVIRDLIKNGKPVEVKEKNIYDDKFWDDIKPDKELTDKDLDELRRKSRNGV